MGMVGQIRDAGGSPTFCTVLGEVDHHPDESSPLRVAHQPLVRFTVKPGASGGR